MSETRTHTSNKDKRRCDFYGSKRGCRKGTSCRFLHADGDDVERTSANNNRKAERQHNRRRQAAYCKYFLESKCKNGDACRFVHSTPKEGPRRHRSAGGGARGGAEAPHWMVDPSDPQWSPVQPREFSRHLSDALSYVAVNRAAVIKYVAGAPKEFQFTPESAENLLCLDVPSFVMGDTEAAACLSVLISQYQQTHCVSVKEYSRGLDLINEVIGNVVKQHHSNGLLAVPDSCVTQITHACQVPQSVTPKELQKFRACFLRHAVFTSLVSHCANSRWIFTEGSTILKSLSNNDVIQSLMDARLQQALYGVTIAMQGFQNFETHPLVQLFIRCVRLSAATVAEAIMAIQPNAAVQLTAMSSHARDAGMKDVCSRLAVSLKQPPSALSQIKAHAISVPSKIASAPDAREYIDWPLGAGGRCSYCVAQFASGTSKRNHYFSAHHSSEASKWMARVGNRDLVSEQRRALGYIPRLMIAHPSELRIWLGSMPHTFASIILNESQRCGILCAEAFASVSLGIFKARQFIPRLLKECQQGDATDPLQTLWALLVVGLSEDVPQLSTSERHVIVQCCLRSMGDPSTRWCDFLIASELLSHLLFSDDYNGARDFVELPLPSPTQLLRRPVREQVAALGLVARLLVTLCEASAGLRAQNVKISTAENIWTDDYDQQLVFANLQSSNEFKRATSLLFAAIRVMLLKIDGEEIPANLRLSEVLPSLITCFEVRYPTAAFAAVHYLAAITSGPVVEVEFNDALLIAAEKALLLPASVEFFPIWCRMEALMFSLVDNPKSMNKFLQLGPITRISDAIASNVDLLSDSACVESLISFVSNFALVISKDKLPRTLQCALSRWADSGLQDLLVSLFKMIPRLAPVDCLLSLGGDLNLPRNSVHQLDASLVQLDAAQKAYVYVGRKQPACDQLKSGYCEQGDCCARKHHNGKLKEAKRALIAKYSPVADNGHPNTSHSK